MINTLFVLLAAILVYAAVLGSGSTVTLVIVAAIVVLGVIAFLIYKSVHGILFWINGTPTGEPGQTTTGVDSWIKNATFAKGVGTGSDPDGSRPTDPPPPDI